MKQLYMIAKRIQVENENPVSLYEKIVGNEQGFLLESNDEIKGRYSFIGKPGKTLIKSEDLSEIQTLLRNYKVHTAEDIPFVGGFVGMISYDIAKKIEQIETINPDTLGLPTTLFFFVEEFVAFDHKTKEVILIVLDEDQENPQIKERLEGLEALISKPNVPVTTTSKLTEKIKINYHTTKDAFIEKVKKAKEYIEAGDIFQVVLSQRVSVKIQSPPFYIYKVLRKVNPSPYLFYFNFGDFQVSGSSPESMVEYRDGYVSTCPIAGTVPRGKNEEEDEQRKQQLLSDEKEIAEHIMLVDLARNDLGKISEIGSIEIPTFMTVEKYSHVMHIVSNVKGKLKEEYSGVDAVLATLPAGTLSGAPKIRAMQIIEELEEEKRGLYGGAVGYFGLDGNMDTCIAIRTVVYKGDTAYIQAGAGIVLDSVPEKEYDETIHKASALITAIQKAEEGDYDFTD